MRAILVSVLAFAALLSGPAAAPAATRTVPTANSVQAYVENQARVRQLSGTVLIQHDGAPAWSRSFGLADRAFDVPMRGDTRFRVASITKAFTSTMILQLAAEGRLALERPIKTYLPDYPGGGSDQVTVHQLLNHTSGIAQYDRIASLEQALESGIPQYQEPLSASAMLKLCCSGPLTGTPGAKFDYNNADYLVLGRIIERLDKRSYEESLKARILVPLGLKDSGIAHQALVIPRLAPTYYWREDRKVWMNDLPVYFENWDAAGAMYSTPADIARFSKGLFGGKLLKPALIEQMLKPGLDDYGYGLWSYSFKRGGRTYRVAKRPGSIMGANAVLYRLIDRHISIIILANTNRADLDQFAQRIAEQLVDQPGSISS